MTVPPREPRSPGEALAAADAEREKLIAEQQRVLDAALREREVLQAVTPRAAEQDEAEAPGRVAAETLVNEEEPDAEREEPDEPSETEGNVWSPDWNGRVPEPEPAPIEQRAPTMDDLRNALVGPEAQASPPLMDDYQTLVWDTFTERKVPLALLRLRRHGWLR